jgi:RNA polymerase sigma factor (sigma-70 family)
MAIDTLSLEEINSKEFVERLKTLDLYAFDIFFESVFPKLVRYLIYTYEQLGDGEIEELASDALFKVHKDIPNFNFDGGAKLTTWVFKIARNTVIDRLRQNAVREAKAEIVLSDTQSGAAAVRSQVFADWSRHGEPGETADPLEPEGDAILRAFSALSASDQDILRMRSCMEYSDISANEGRDEGALRTRHSRALQRLDSAYKKEVENGGA